MAKEKNYLNFEQVEQKKSRKTKVWNVVNKSGVVLGEVSWHPHWRQYTFYSAPSINPTIWSAGCLKQVQTFIQDEMETHVIRRKLTRLKIEASDGNVEAQREYDHSVRALGEAMREEMEDGD